jgi:transposase
MRESDRHQEQGISKVGNRYLRALAIELAWSWLRRQPQSALSQWYQRRYATGGRGFGGSAAWRSRGSC